MIRVAITSDVRIFCESMAIMLGQQRDIEVVGTNVSVIASAELADALQPDVHIVDCTTADALAALRVLALRAPRVRTVAVGIAECERAAIECPTAGVAGYVTRQDPPGRLLEVVRRVTAGGHSPSRPPRPARAGPSKAQANGRPWSPEASLTARECQILQLIDDGLSNRGISEDLQIELSTVKNHVHRILAKLGVERRTQAAARFRRWQTVGLHDRALHGDRAAHPKPVRWTLD